MVIRERKNPYVSHFWWSCVKEETVRKFSSIKNALNLNESLWRWCRVSFCARFTYDSTFLNCSIVDRWFYSIVQKNHFFNFFHLSKALSQQISLRRRENFLSWPCHQLSLIGEYSPPRSKRKFVTELIYLVAGHPLLLGQHLPPRSKRIFAIEWNFRLSVFNRRIFSSLVQANIRYQVYLSRDQSKCRN